MERYIERHTLPPPHPLPHPPPPHPLFQEAIPPPVEKFYFLNVNKVEYKRETPTPTPTDTMNDPMQLEPTHRLVVHDLKVTSLDPNCIDWFC